MYASNLKNVYFIPEKGRANYIPPRELPKYFSSLHYQY